MESWDDQPCELIAYLTEDLEDDTTSTGAGSASFDHGCADMCLAYDGSEDSLADEIDDEKGPACAASPHVQGHVADSTIGATSAGVSSTEDARAGRDQPHGFTEHAFKAAASTQAAPAYHEATALQRTNPTTSHQAAYGSTNMLGGQREVGTTMSQQGVWPPPDTAHPAQSEAMIAAQQVAWQGVAPDWRWQGSSVSGLTGRQNDGQAKAGRNPSQARVEWRVPGLISQLAPAIGHILSSARRHLQPRASQHRHEPFGGAIDKQLASSSDWPTPWSPNIVLASLTVWPVVPGVWFTYVVVCQFALGLLAFIGSHAQLRGVICGCLRRLRTSMSMSMSMSWWWAGLQTHRAPARGSYSSRLRATISGAWERCLQSVAIQPRDEKHVRSVGHSATEPVVALDDIPAILDEQKEAITAAVFDAWDPAPIVAKREQLLGLYKLLQGTGYDSLIMESYVAMLREVLERGLRRLQVQEHRFCTYPICAKNACGRETAGELVSKVEKYMSAVDPQWTAPARQEWCNGVDGQLDGYFDPNM